MHHENRKEKNGQHTERRAEMTEICSEKNMQVQQRPGRLLRDEDVAVLESLQEETSGYFEGMIEYLERFIESGIEEGRFSEEEARADLEIALWYAYACNNVDDYEHYYMTVQWMPSSQKNADGCGAWYYRYSCALMYCGRLQEALKYAEEGTRQQPEYPWSWLQTAKLKSHFGDRKGALASVERGLSLVPEDYEFLTLRREIQEGKSLAEMEYHYIDPDSDHMLQSGMAEDSAGKLQAISGILCDEEALKAIRRIFDPDEWEADSPYCMCRFHIGGKELSGIFCMNEAALSKMNPDWLRDQKEKLASGDYFLLHRGKNSYVLKAVVFGRDYSTELLYHDPEHDQSFQICVRRNGVEADLPEPLLLDMALNEMEKYYNDSARHSEAEGAAGNDGAGEESFPGSLYFSGGSEPMFLLYRRENGVIYYAECRAQGTDIAEHSGIVGEQGRTEIHSCENFEEHEEFMNVFRQWYISQGYEEWPEEEQNWVAVRLPVNPVHFDDMSAVLSEETADRQEMTAWLLDEAFSRTGLGWVDGWEIEQRQDEPGDFAFEVYCIAVETNGVVETVRRALEEKVDCSGLRISVLEPGREEYRLLYSADDTDTEKNRAEKSV